MKQVKTKYFAVEVLLTYNEGHDLPSPVVNLRAIISAIFVLQQTFLFILHSLTICHLVHDHILQVLPWGRRRYKKAIERIMRYGLQTKNPHYA